MSTSQESLSRAEEILSVCIHCDKDAKRTTEPELIEAGRKPVAGMSYDKNDDRQDYSLRTIVDVCLGGEVGGSDARTFAGRFKAAVGAYKAYAFHYDQFVQALFRAQPRALLDAFFGGGEKDRNLGVRAVEDICHIHENPMDQVPDDMVIAWCAEDAAIRYALIAGPIRFTSVDG